MNSVNRGRKKERELVGWEATLNQGDSPSFLDTCYVCSVDNPCNKVDHETYLLIQQCDNKMVMELSLKRRTEKTTLKQ